MKKPNLFILIVSLYVLLGFVQQAYAQSEPVLYFCERYDEYRGEVGVSDRFTTGYLTVVVKADYALGLREVSIQFDKYNIRAGVFEYYKKFNYTVKPDMNYIYFEGEDLSFDKPGIYRVFLLDERDKTVASGLIEIIKK